MRVLPPYVLCFAVMLQAGLSRKKWTGFFSEVESQRTFFNASARGPASFVWLPSGPCRRRDSSHPGALKPKFFNFVLLRSKGLVQALTAVLAGALYSPPAWTQSLPSTALVGPGTTDPSPHQLVRSSKNVLYVITFDCKTGYSQCGPNRVRIYAATTGGLPKRFVEKDAAHAARGGIQSVAAAIDGQDIIHVLWIDRNGVGHINYADFDTSRGLWGTRTVLMTSHWTDNVATQGAEGVAIALDAAGNPHALWSARTAISLPLRVFYANQIGGTWTKPVAIDTQPVPVQPYFSEHPTLAFTPTGDLLAAWIDGSCTISQAGTCYTPDGKINTRVRQANGTWLGTVALPDRTFPSIDNGPTLIVTADGTRHISFTNAASGHENEIRYWYDSGNGWQGDEQPPTQVTHDPSIGPDGAGGLYIFGHGTPEPNYYGVGQNVYYFHKAAGSTTWGAWTLFVTGSYDDATSVRWSQFFQNFPNYVDATFWTTNSPYTLYVGTFLDAP